jgi:hypothetical protein
MLGEFDFASAMPKRIALRTEEQFCSGRIVFSFVFVQSRSECDEFDLGVDSVTK